jgi:hypothetical protein
VWYAFVVLSRAARRILGSIVIGLLMAPGWAQGDEPTWQIGASVYHSTGNYGTDSETTITSVPLSIRRLFRDGDITFIVPLLSVTSDCNVTLLSGVPNKTGGTCPTQTITTKNGKQVTRLRQTRTTETGIGDLVLRGRYYVLDDRGFIPTVALTGRVKIPTADRDRGLGTGEFDEGVGIEVSKMLTDQWIGFVDLGYTFVGDPPGLDLRNQWSYDIGGGYYFTKALLASAYYEEWTSVIAGLANPRDLLFALNYTAAPAFRVNGSIARGLSSGAPDWAFTAGVNVRF